MLKHKLLTKFTLVVASLLISVAVISVLPSKASAFTCPDGFKNDRQFNQAEYDSTCADHKTGGTAKDSEEGSSSVNSPEPPAGGTIEKAADDAFGGCSNGGDEATGCGIVEKYVNPLINFLAAAVGMVVTIMIIVGGIQYSSAGGDPAKVTAAKNKIINALIAFGVFLSLYAILSWLIPGGFF